MDVNLCGIDDPYFLRHFDFGTEQGYAWSILSWWIVVLNALRTSGSVLCRSFRVSLLPLVTIRTHEQTPFLL
jgi:hypothetical protein